MIQTYIKKPQPVVQAVYVKKDTAEEIIKLLKTCVTKYETIINKRTKKIVGFMIYTWEGAEPVYLGEDYYIVKGSRSEAYPCEGNIFRGRYEEVK